MLKAYIPNQGSNAVTVVDTGTNTALTGTGYPISVGNEPTGAAVSPDGLRTYVTNRSSASLSIIDTTTDTVVATVSVGSAPAGVAVSPDGNKVYVANQGGGSVSIIDAGSHVVLATATVGRAPWGVAVTPDGTKAYVPNGTDGTVSVIDAATNSTKTGAGYPVNVGTSPAGVAISPDGSKAYVTNQGSNSVSVINTASDTVSTTITTNIGSSPTGVAFSPDGSQAYVTGIGGTTVAVIDTSSDTVKTGTGYPITVGNGASSVAFSPDGATAYVVNSLGNSVSAINTSTLSASTISSAQFNSPEGVAFFIQPPSTPMTSTYAAPQGRLTLTSNTPVMTTDTTGATSVYYTPYQGNIVPIYDGANMQSYSFGQLTMSLNTSNQTNGNIYDLFVFLNSSVVTIGAGPAWSSSTSRGTGAGTTELEQIDGLWVNKNSITLKNSSASYSSIPVGEATYLGSVYMTANGQTGMQFQPSPASGGSDNALGLYNAYNRVTVASRSVDSTADWSYNSTTWRAANGSSSNRINWLDGLQQSFVRADYQVQANAGSGNVAFASIGLDSTTTPQTTVYGVNESVVTNIRSAADIPPQLGLHYVQALESTEVGSVTYYSYAGSYPVMQLKAVLEM